MKKNKHLNWLIPLIGTLAAAASLTGLLWRGGPGPRSFTPLQGGSVLLSGKGLYRFDSLFSSGAFLGTDAFTLAIGIPLLLITFFLYRKSSLRRELLRLGTLSFFLYNSASMAFGAVYNELFLVYIAYFGASLFAFIIVFRNIDPAAVSKGVSARMPSKGIALFLFIAGGVLAFVWGSDIAGSLIAGQAPSILGPYTTMVTYVIDLGIILPCVFLSGVMLGRKKPEGYVLSFVMIFLYTLIGIIIIAQTIAQVNIGITYSAQEIIVFISSFLLMSAVSCWMLILFLKNINPGSAAGT